MTAGPAAGTGAGAAFLQAAVVDEGAQRGPGAQRVDQRGPGVPHGGAPRLHRRRADGGTPRPQPGTRGGRRTRGGGAEGGTSCPWHQQREQRSYPVSFFINTTPCLPGHLLRALKVKLKGVKISVGLNAFQL